MEKFNDYMAVRIFSQDHYILNLRDLKDYDYGNNGRKPFYNPYKLNQIVSNLEMDETYSEFMGRQIEKVPVLRIFGSTKRGQTAWINIHNYLPYFFIEFHDILVNEGEDHESFLHRLAESIEDEYNHQLSNRHTAYKYKGSYRVTQVIHSLSIIKDFNSVYGYHQESDQKFIKITVYDPDSVTRLRDLLWSGVVLRFRFQSYEAHLTYFMHLYTDYDLYGMEFLKIKNFKFRRNGLPKLKKSEISRKTLYPVNFWYIHGESRPLATYNWYSFLQDDIDLKLFDEKDMMELANDSNQELYSNYK